MSEHEAGGHLDISSLKNATDALEKSVFTYAAYAGSDVSLTETLRSGVIQNFEVAYELAWKFMKRWLENNISPDIVMGVNRREFYRIAAANQLIVNTEAWWEFHEARNRTSHIYDKMIADDVFVIARKFLPCVQDFIARLEPRL